MRTIVLIILFSTFNLLAYTQNWEWASVGVDRDNGDFGRVIPNGICVDSAGNTYVTGLYYDSLVIDTFKIISNGSGAFWAKFDKTGKCVWVKNTGAESSPGDIILDKKNNIYVFLSYSGTAPNIDLHINNTSGYKDLLLLKYDSAGNLLDYKIWGSRYDDLAANLTIDKSGHLYLYGSFNGYVGTPYPKDTIVFGSYSLGSIGGNDLFIVQLDDTLGVSWAERAGGALGDYAFNITTDSLNNVFITGMASGSFSSDSIHVTNFDLIFLLLNTISQEIYYGQE